MAINTDCKDLLRLLSEEKAEFLLVGAHAVIYYSQPRYTKDMDILVRPSAENAQRVWNALVRFGAPLQGVGPNDFCNPELIYQIGVEPNRIDILMAIEGIDFDRAWTGRVGSTYDGLPIQIIGKADLIRAKQAAGRPQDLLDLKHLTGP